MRGDRDVRRAEDDLRTARLQMVGEPRVIRVHVREHDGAWGDVASGEGGVERVLVLRAAAVDQDRGVAFRDEVDVAPHELDALDL